MAWISCRQYTTFFHRYWKRLVPATLLAASVLLKPTVVQAQQPTILPSHMQDGRWAAATVRMADGRLLIVGGYSFAKKNTVTSADIFDPATSTFSPAALIYGDRNFATATLLSPGNKILIAGGYSEHHGGSRASAVIYAPSANTWTYTRTPMNDRRELFTATRLKDGKVLLVGGLSLRKRGTLATAELYDPMTDSFTPTKGTLTDDRFGHSAALLPEGRVLIVGGQSWKIGQPSRTLASAEIYDPATDRFTPTVAPMHFARDRCTTTLLNDGQVLIAGGTNQGKPPLPAELFDSTTGTFRLAASLHEGRMAHDACLLPDGRVLVAGGWSDSRKATTPAVEVYDPAKDIWTTLHDLPFSAHDLSLFWFPMPGSTTGHVLAIGGKATPGDEDKATSIDTGAWIEWGAK